MGGSLGGVNCRKPPRGSCCLGARRRGALNESRGGAFEEVRGGGRGERVKSVKAGGGGLGQSRPSRCRFSPFFFWELCWGEISLFSVRHKVRFFQSGLN